MWVSIGSDLRIDTRRDLDDVGATHISVHALNKLPYGRLTSAKVQPALHYCHHHHAVLNPTNSYACTADSLQSGWYTTSNLLHNQRQQAAACQLHQVVKEMSISMAQSLPPALLGCSSKGKLLLAFCILTSSDDCYAHRYTLAKGSLLTTAHHCVEMVLGLQVGVGEGVIFLTYSSLTSSSDKGDTRLQQLVDWAGPHFDGLIIFDECHKAKNLIPEAGSKSTKVWSQHGLHLPADAQFSGHAGLLECLQASV